MVRMASAWRACACACAERRHADGSSLPVISSCVQIKPRTGTMAPLARCSIPPLGFTFKKRGGGLDP